MKVYHVMIITNKIINLMESYVWIIIIILSLNVENVNLIVKLVILLHVRFVMMDII